MAGLTEQTNSPDAIIGKSGSNNGKSPSEIDAGNSPLCPYSKLIYVCYLNHVLFNRSSAVAMVPQIIKQTRNDMIVETSKAFCLSFLKKRVEVAA